MDKYFIIILLTFSVFITGRSFAQKWHFELYGGAPVNLPMPLKIKQEGFPDIRLTARYYSEPFVSPWYWIWRFIRSGDNCRYWEFEAVHHKLYLRNLPGEVHNFSITHGLNLLNISTGKRITVFSKYPFKIKYGAGPVLAHPENTVRGLRLDENAGIFGKGYYLCGAGLNLAVQKSLFLIGKRIYSSFEVKLNPSCSWVPVVNGQARVLNVAIQAIFGFGVVYLKKEEDTAPAN